MSKGNLILGYATNASAEAIAPFVASARKWHSESDCKIVLFVSSGGPNAQGIAELAEKYSIDLVPATCLWNGRRNLSSRLGARGALAWWRKFNKNGLHSNFDASAHALAAWIHPHYSRWYDYHRFLSLYPTFKSVFLSDVTDVFFQGNVFPQIEKNGLTVAKQPHTFNHSNVDSIWMREAYGAKRLEELQGKTAICIGTIGGDLNSVLRLSHAMWSDFYAKPHRGIEQAIFNHLFYSNTFSKVFEKSNQDPFVLTISDPKDCANLNIDERGIHDGGSYPSVVHMYNRLPNDWLSKTTELIRKNMSPEVD